MSLRIPTIHGAKITKKNMTLVHFYFATFQKFGIGIGWTPYCKVIKQNIPGGSVFTDSSTMYSRDPS